MFLHRYGDVITDNTGRGMKGTRMIRFPNHRTSQLLALGMFFLVALAGHRLCAEEFPQITFQKLADRLEINVHGEPFATYVFRDETTRRPYFMQVHADGGVQVTRQHPPREGQELTDHATMHPGIWLAFGDIGGADFWRNQGQVEHAGFVQQPQVDGNQASFAVMNDYLARDQTICTEICRYTIWLRPAGRLLICDSRFRSARSNFTFGDQEEMGLGIRVAPQLRVRDGKGRLLNSHGKDDVKQIWGQMADWCDYSGIIDDHQVGMLLMPAPDNFRKSWFHARDYGLLVANPFGLNAFTRGEKSRIDVPVGKEFRLQFGVLIHRSPAKQPTDLKSAYQDFLNCLTER